MAPAAVIACEEARPAGAKTRIRQQLHAQMDCGLDRLEAYMPEGPPSLEELTQAVVARRQEWTGKITDALVAQRQGALLHQRTLPCPQCHRLLPARPAPVRPGHTRGGEVSLARPSFACTHGERGVAPLDEALQLSERRAPWDLQQAAARLAAEVPCATAQGLFTQLRGLALSDHTMQAVAGELSHELGVLDASPTAGEMAARVAEMAAGKPWRPVLGLALAGACVPTRPEEAKGPATGRRHPRATRAGWQGAWKEATGCRFSLVDQERLVPLVSWSQVGWDEEVGAALRQGKEAGVIPEAQGRLCGLGDGAKWLGHQGTTLLPTAVPILDDSHGREHGHRVGALPFADDAGPAQAWVEAMMARLFGAMWTGRSRGCRRCRPGLPRRPRQSAR